MATIDRAVIIVDENGDPVDFSCVLGNGIVKGEVQTFADLPAVATMSGETYLVYQETGAWLLFTKKRAGLYRSNGVAWTRMGDMITRFNHDEFFVYDSSDNTKKTQLITSGISSGTTRKLTIQDKDITIAGLADIPAASAKAKVSVADTTSNYLNSKVTVSDGSNTTDIIEKAIGSPGGNETLNLQVDETKVDHDNILNTHNLTTDIDHDSINNTHNLTTDIDHDSITNTHNLTTDIDHDSITNTHNLTTDIDHDSITNTHNLTTDLTPPASNVSVLEIGTATYDDVQDIVTLTGSAGRITGGAISDAGSQTYNVAAGTGMIRSTNSEIGSLYFFDWAASNGNAIADGEIKYIFIDYNTPPVVLIKDTFATNTHDEFFLGSVVREGTTLHIFNNPDNIANFAMNTMERLRHQEFERVEGLILGETGTRNITVTEGETYFKVNEYILAAFDSTGASRFDTYINATQDASAQAAWDNQNYNNAGSKTALGTNKFGVLWFYQEIDGHLLYLYGTSNTVSVAGAQAEAPPTTLPKRIQAHGYLIGRLIFQKNAATASVIETAFGTTFTSAVATSHNSLAGLNDGDYQHLTAANNTDLTDSGDSALHYHSTDRDRANHTGTQTADTITDGVTNAIPTLTQETNWDNHLGATANPHATDIENLGAGTLAELNAAISNADVDDDGDPRDPNNHASNHTDGTDDIQDATDAQKGLATAAQITKLDGIEASADVNNISDVNATDLTDGGETALHSHAGGLGDVVGPGSAVNNGVTRYDTTSGKLIQDSLATLDNNGTFNIPTGEQYQVNSAQHQHVLADITDNVFGTEFATDEDTSDRTTTSATYVEAHGITTPSLPAGRYYIEVMFVWSSDSTTSSSAAQVQVDNTSTILGGEDMIVEASENSPVNKYTVNMTTYQELSAAAHDIDLDFHADGSDTMTMFNSRITYYRVT